MAGFIPRSIHYNFQGDWKDPSFPGSKTPGKWAFSHHLDIVPENQLLEDGF